MRVIYQIIFNFEDDKIKNWNASRNVFTTKELAEESAELYIQFIKEKFKEELKTTYEIREIFLWDK